jgi:hypothetical protein
VERISKEIYPPQRPQQRPVRAGAQSSSHSNAAAAIPPRAR